MTKNTHTGSTFESFLQEEGIADEVNAAAARRVLAWQEMHDRVLAAVKDTHALEVEEDKDVVIRANGLKKSWQYRYNFNVAWSEEDGEWVGTCAEFPSLSHLAPAKDAAMCGIMQLVEETFRDLD